MNYYISNSELYHFGILGQKWGVRRYQDKNGRYTQAGKDRRRRDIHINLPELTDEQKEEVKKTVKEVTAGSVKAYAAYHIVRTVLAGAVGALAISYAYKNREKISSGIKKAKEKAEEAIAVAGEIPIGRTYIKAR